MAGKQIIGLIDVDGHNYPNLALMKLSAWYKKKGDHVEFVNHFMEYDIVYKSKIFTFTPFNDFAINSKQTLYGGTGYNLVSELPGDIEHTEPDYSLYNYPHALGFLTRGCVRNCWFCLVPKKEGTIRPHAEIDEFLNGRKTAILMDNNVLASDHGIKQIERIIKLKIKVDFNQGLDARLINRNIAKLLSDVKWLKPIRMACDSPAMITYVKNATKLLREAGARPSRFFVYVLVTNIKEAHAIVTELNKIGLDPFAQPLITETKKPTKEQKRFARWVNHKAIFRSVEYEKYL